MNKLGLCILALVTALVTVGCGEVVDMQPPDPCAGGTCECAVETEDTDCGAHEYCNATDSGRTCECVAGYTKGVNGCAWTGVIRDPALATPSEWTPVSGALMNPTAAGGVDPGEASFLPSALCSLAHVKQTVTMPAHAKAEPLVLELGYKNQSVFSPMGFDHVLMGVSFGGGWSPFPDLGDASFHNVRICLPEGAYAPRGTAGAGAPVTFAFGPYEQPARCPNSMISNFAVDHAAIVPANAGECSAKPGEGVNFDAERTGGWTFSVSGGATGGFVSGAGANGSRAARIALAMGCDSASMETTLDIPAVANPALEMFASASAGANVSMSIGGGVLSMKPFETIPAAATTRTLRTCLPPAMRGQTMKLALFLSSSGVCAEVHNHQLAVDNVRVVDDPTCDARAGFANGGFEHAGQLVTATSGTDPATSMALVRNAPGQARSGTRYLALESYRRCTGASYFVMPLVPAPSGGAGPALKLFANVTANPDATTYVTSRASTGLTLTEGGGYRPYTFCLNPLYAGRPQLVTIGHDGGAGACNNVGYGQQLAFIDDLEVTTDPSCSAQ